MPHRHGHHRSPEPPIPAMFPHPAIVPEASWARFSKLFSSGRGHGWSGSFGPFRFDFDDGFGGRGGRGGRGGGRRHPGRKRMFEGGELRLVLLKLIADEPRHGYDCIRAVEEITGGEYAPSPGIVYPTLTMLEEMGLIEEQKSEDSKKVFAVTDEGRAHLEENEGQVESLIDRLTDMKPEERPHAGPAIGRAVKNLMTAMTQRISRDGFDEELFHEIAAVLDEAAQRIERIK
ncbi:MAG TPA: PadR family transcriptional regulator [Sphingomicrobium sp.]|nr:PadR family transcriptional regulator [Sphingomicrobium sp.]